MTRHPALRIVGALTLLMAGLFLAVTDALAQLAGGSDPEVTFQTGGLELSDDDNATALFNVAAMKPGDTVTRCITVNYTGDARDSVIRLHGTAAGAAAGDLRLRIETGTGGTFSSCAGFTGVPTYDGPLTVFSASHDDFATGLPVATPLAAPGAASFMISMTLGAGADQGETGAATFTWEAGQLVTLPPVTVPPLPTIPTVTIPGEPKESPGPVTRYGTVGRAATPEASPVVEPAPVVEAALPATPPENAPAPAPKPRSRVARENASSPNDSVLDVIVAVATEAAKKGAFPTGLVLLVIAFLIIQDRIDRKDPKLALAPVYAEADLQFTQRGDELE